MIIFIWYLNKRDKVLSEALDHVAKVLKEYNELLNQHMKADIEIQNNISLALKKIIKQMNMRKEK